ncbi:MAG: hypothetical protein ACE147_12670 [Candidatus Methylomirabilales bacterium]
MPRPSEHAGLAAALRPVTLLTGHYGSGKTEIAVNLALALRAAGAEVSLVDLDLVKPYFRCRLARAELAGAGVRLVAPEGARLFADLPILVPEAAAAARGGAAAARRVVLDVGGADTGARVLGSLAALGGGAAVDALFVVNSRRPFAEDLDGLRAMLHDVQAAARLPVTGLVANGHLMQETTPATVRDGLRAARALEAATGVPLRFAAMLAPLAGELAGPAGGLDGLPVLPLTRYIRAPFEPGARGVV